jgi:polyether ionophore transport system permease protein
VGFLYSLRLTRWGIAGFSAFGFFTTIFQALGFYSVAGHTAAERASFARSMQALAAQFTVLIAAPARPDTAGGYVQWRAYGLLAIVFGIWALVSAYGAARGDEERGLLEQVLATGTPRPDALVARFLAFAAGGVVGVSAAALGVIAGVYLGHETIDASGLAGASINLLALTLFCYAITMVVCQLAGTRHSLAAASVVLLALFLLNSLSRQLDVLAGWRWLSPFRYYDLSRPLAPGGAFDVRGVEIMFGGAVVAMLTATLAFAYRDLGAPLVQVPAATHPAIRRPDGNPLWRVPVVRSVFDRRAGLLAWTLGVAILGVLFVVLTKSVVQPLLGLAQLRPFLDVILAGAIYQSFLGFIWFGFAQLLFAGFAIAQVARWSGEDMDGRLEAALSSPTSRRMIVIERCAVLLAGALVIAAVSGAAVGVEAHAQSIDLDRGRLVAASLLLVPIAMIFAAVGSLLTTVLPRATVGLLGAFAFASYLLNELGPLFHWPGWVLDLSAFHLYGQPLRQGVDSTGLAIMVLIVAVGFVASALMMEKRDIGA